MKNLLLIFCLLGLTLNLSAQDFGDEPSTDNSSDIVSVLDVSGKAKYKAPESKRFKRIKPGAVLEKSGSVKLNKKGKLDLLYKGHPAKLDGKGKHTLDNLTVSDDAETDDFMAFLSTASGFAGPGGRAKKDTTTQEPAGGHGKGKRILGTQPPGGKVVIKPTTFSWTDGGVDQYMFKLYQGDNSTPVFSEEVTTTELKVNLADIDGLQSNTPYKWQIETTTEEGITRKSPAIEITLATVDESDKLLQNLRGMEVYRKSSSWEKRLREVHTLRSNGFFIEAKAIARMITKQFPKNKIVEGAAALF